MCANATTFSGIALMLAVLFLAFATLIGCDEYVCDNPAYSNSIWGVVYPNSDNVAGAFLELSIEPQFIRLDELPKIVQLTIKNVSDFVYWGGNRVAIDYFDGDDWVRVITPFTRDVGIRMPGRTSRELNVYLNPDIHSYCDKFVFVTGRYRIVHSNWFVEFFVIDYTNR